MSTTAAGYEFLTCYICGKTYLRATEHVCEPPPEIFKPVDSEGTALYWWRGRAEKAEATVHNQGVALEAYRQEVSHLNAEIAALKAGLASLLVVLNRARTGPGDITQKRLNAENYVHGVLIGLLNLLPLPKETLENWQRRYKETLERLQKGGEG